MANHSAQVRADPLSTIRLTELDPDLLAALSDEQRAEASRVPLPVIDVSERGIEIASLLADAGAFAAVVLEGMVQYHIQVGDQVALVVLGPGDVVAAPDEPRSLLIAAAESTALANTRLALLDEGFLRVASRWPHIHARLQGRMASEARRLATQLAICQLPRVADRLLAMMWLLAESWGHVTGAGTVLPLSFTHEALGGLVGARRSTVTLALGELAEGGALVHQDRGWLLLEEPQQRPGLLKEARGLTVLADEPSEWGRPTHDTPRDVPSRDVHIAGEMTQTVHRLRVRHQSNVEATGASVRQAVAARQRAREVREQARDRRRLSPWSPPSS